MILLTGGAGFIGSNILADLNAAGRSDVAVCDRLGTGEKWRNLAKRSLADLVLPEQLEGWLQRYGGAVEAVVHLGAISSTTVTDADAVVRDNVQATLALWRFCAAAEVPLVYASSAATYGDGALGFDDALDLEGVRALRPLNLYGWSKQAVDVALLSAVARGEPAPPRWYGLKYFNVFGPNEAHKGPMRSVVRKLAPAILAGERVQLFASDRADVADGGQARDFVWVEDAAATTLWLLGSDAPSGLYNVGTGQARSFAELVGAAFVAAGREPAIDYVPMPPELRGRYQYFTEATTAKLAAAGRPPRPTPLQEAVRRYLQDYLAASDPYR